MRANVLVIEDIFDTLKGTVKYLELEGARIFRAPTVRDARNELQRQPFSLILLDWRLPEDVAEPVHPNAGALVLRALRENVTGPNATTPVLVVTAEKSAVDSRAFEGQRNSVRVLSKLRHDQILSAAREVLHAEPS